MVLSRSQILCKFSLPKPCRTFPVSKYVVVLRGTGWREKEQEQFSLLSQICMKCFPCFLDFGTLNAFSVHLSLVLSLFYGEGDWWKKGIAQKLCSSCGMDSFLPGALTMALPLTTPLHLTFFLPKCFCSMVFTWRLAPFYKKSLLSKHSWI